MLEKFLIYLLKKPQVKAALVEIIQPCLETKSNYQKRLEALIDKMKSEPEFYQSVLDDLRKNPTSFSRSGKFPPPFYAAAVTLYAQVKNPELHTAH
ncbi:hypothetical protein CEP76_05665 [[Haemophilus] ducreyi]|uniref:hypothetical protein n=1 Tax=Haemophilus ducreyi TaxID=730 RepID=UPI000654F65F|nr:hypothetical protein [[Haemophilus] ducreyi]AKO40032.1 hypothetical protein RZ63_06115 [[Haemophilus] ducreyi]ASE07162.1 hypothetical protein CEP76_05665 [[Haemophilus] ducreyi]